MSDSTTSAGPPSRSRRICGAFSSRKSSSRKSTPGIGVHLQKIDGDHAALALLGADALGATWLQPPGAAPRSTTLRAGLEEMEFVVDLGKLVRPRASESRRAWRAPHRDH
jgi:hypothetical protein